GGGLSIYGSFRHDRDLEKCCLTPRGKLRARPCSSPAASRLRISSKLCTAALHARRLHRSVRPPSPTLRRGHGCHWILEGLPRSIARARDLSIRCQPLLSAGAPSWYRYEARPIRGSEMDSVNPPSVTAEMISLNRSTSPSAVSPQLSQPHAGKA